MKKLFILMLFFSLAGYGKANLFEEGNRAYAEGNYQEAIEKYRSILDQGQTAPAVHYNLANAHYKLNHIASSIYHYEKALQLDPGDEDIRNNLVFAQNMTIDDIEPAPAVGFSALFEEKTAVLDISGWAWMGIFFMLLFVVFFMGYYFSRKPLVKRILFIGGIFLMLCGVASVVVGYAKQDLQEERSFAVIFSEEAEVRSEPTTRSPEIFTLHEGTKIRVLEDFQGWTKIRIPNGNQGWMEDIHFKRL